MLTHNLRTALEWGILPWSLILGSLVLAIALPGIALLLFRRGHRDDAILACLCLAVASLPAAFSLSMISLYVHARIVL